MDEIVFESSPSDVLPNIVSPRHVETSSSRLHFFKKDSLLNNVKEMKDNQSNTPSQRQRIKASSLNGLISYLTDPEICNVEFRDVFLLTYRSYSTPIEILQLLLNRFGTPVEQEEKMQAIQFRVFSAIKAWLDVHWWYDFENNDPLKEKLLKFIQSLSGPLWGPRGAQLLSVIERIVISKKTNNFISNNKLPIIIPNGPLPASHQLSDFSIITVQEFSRQLSLFDFQLHTKIAPSELIGQAWSSKDRTKAPNVLSVISFFNKLSNWTACNIVYHRKIENRCEALIWFINLAEELVRINNYNGAFAVKSGINSSPVRRLQKTWERIPESWNMRLNELEKLLTSDSNYKAYRKIICEIEPPMLPYLGIYLRDLTYIEDGNKDFLDNKMINFDKCYKVATVITSVQQYQKLDYQVYFDPIPDVQEWLSTLLHPTENELYAKSLRVEPKNVWESYEKEVERNDFLENKVIDLMERIDILEKQIKMLETNKPEDRKNAWKEVKFNSAPSASPQKILKGGSSRMGHNAPRKTANFAHVVLNETNHHLWDKTS